MGYRIVSRLIGLLLLASAALKSQGLAVGPVAQIGILGATWLQVAVIEFEVVLGLWLLWGGYPFGSWITTLATFTTFAGVSFYSGWIGQTSCGCFGELPVSPWWAFGLDVGVIVGLLFIRPFRQSSDSGAAAGPIARWIFRSGVAGVTITTVMLVGAMAAFGSLEGALAFTRGYSVYASPSTIDLGTKEPGEMVDFDLALANRGPRSFQVVGGTFDCNCSVVEDLPIEIQPNGSAFVKGKIQFPKSAGAFKRWATVWTTDPDRPTVRFLLVGRVKVRE